MYYHREEPGRQAPATMRRSTYIFSVSLALVVGFVIGTRFDAMRPSMFGNARSQTLDLSTVAATYDTLKREYDGNLDMQKLIDGASRGLVAAAGDDYTVYMDTKEAKEFRDSLSGEIGGGIGAEIGMRSDQPTIVTVLDNNPAATAGLQRGDIIIGINELSTKGWSLEKTIQHVRGEVGTSVKLSVRRGEAVEQIAITRAKINDPSVRVSERGNTGIIRLTRFDDTSGKLLREAAERLKQKGINSIVLDLRDNGGGYVEAAQEVAGVWLDREVILTEKRGGETIATEKSIGQPLLANMPTVVLINGGSASASEIIAGSFREYGVARLIGERSFGKGTVQKLVELSGGRLLRVTIARWYTPQGKNITKEGITPQQVVELTQKNVNAGEDPQLDAAIVFLEHS